MTISGRLIAYFFGPPCSLCVCVWVRAWKLHGAKTTHALLTWCIVCRHAQARPIHLYELQTDDKWTILYDAIKIMYYYAIENILVNHILLYLHGKLEKTYTWLLTEIGLRWSCAFWTFWTHTQSTLCRAVVWSYDTDRLGRNRLQQSEQTLTEIVYLSTLHRFTFAVSGWHVYRVNLMHRNISQTPWHLV